MSLKKLSHVFLVTSLTLFLNAIGNASENRSFVIDYDSNTFLKDGKPFRYISGSVHYFRIVEDRWDDILRKLYLGGLNTVQTYVEWSSHQPTPSVENLNFQGNLNIIKFLETAQKNNLNVILRPGPFIDAERDMGGLPPWLLWQTENMKLRTSDLEYVYYVAHWFDKFLPMIKPFLYVNGGPIIMVQVENEYGSYFACDRNYTTFLRDLIKHHLGDEVLLFTTDGSGAGYLKCGTIPQVYPTVDFGPTSTSSVLANFGVQKQFAPKGPLVNSEFYPGWLDHWQHPHSQTNTVDVTSTLESMLSLNASVNIYMFHGGTSFGFGAGSNQDSTSFNPCPTSYDYDAPLTEAGDPTEKYFAIKKIISKFRKVPEENPQVAPKMKLGKIYLRPFASVLDPQFLMLLSRGIMKSELPLSFEDMKVGSGFVLYETTIDMQTTDPAVLSIPDLKDRAYVYSNMDLQGILSRSEKIFAMPIFVRKGQKLRILVENQGRPCYGKNLDESKGIGSKVTLAGETLLNWTMYRIGTFDSNMLQKYALQSINGNFDAHHSLQGAGFYAASFLISNETEIRDTFLRLNGWNKGLVWINGFNLGRYWPVVGPQETLYLPAPLLRQGKNTLIILELESAPEGCNVEAEGKPSCTVILTDTHVINGTTPLKTEVKATMLSENGRFPPQPLNAVQNVNIKLRADTGMNVKDVETVKD